MGKRKTMSFILYNENCLDAMKRLEDNSVDSIVTDPPYGLSFMGKKWDYDVPSVEIWAECLRVLKPGGHLLAFAGTRTQHRMAVRIEDAGFEIRDMIAWVYSSGFPKSHNMDNHRGKLTCNCDGTTLPYTHEKNISRESEAECDLHGLRGGYVSSPKHTGQGRREVLQQGLQEQGSPLEGWEEFPPTEEGAGQSSMEGRGHLQKAQGELQRSSVCESAGMGKTNGSEGWLHHGASSCDGENVRVSFDEDGGCQSQRPQPIEQSPVESGVVPDERRPQARGSWPVCGGCGKPIVPKGFGTALKPSHEPITVARKPLIGTVAQNVLEHGTGALNIDGCRVGDTVETWPKSRSYAPGQMQPGHSGATQSTGKAPTGRWPANLIHDGSDEVVAGFPVTGASRASMRGEKTSAGTHDGWARESHKGFDSVRGHNDNGGSAARFFYCAKASKKDRDEGLEGFEEKRTGGMQATADGSMLTGSGNERTTTRANVHPTVKPTDLMRYLCRLVTPPGGVVLDPFTGSGSTGKAAMLEGFSFIGCELSEEYAAIANARIEAAINKEDEESIPQMQLL
jgi:DNA modification methylase